MGNQYLRKLLVIGVTSRVRAAKYDPDRLGNAKAQQTLSEKYNRVIKEPKRINKNCKDDEDYGNPGRPGN